MFTATFTKRTGEQITKTFDTVQAAKAWMDAKRKMNVGKLIVETDAQGTKRIWLAC